ncbi:MAG: lipopolysaccharide biosynthesis protein, partial [Halanaerobiales bacterium]
LERYVKFIILISFSVAYILECIIGLSFLRKKEISTGSFSFQLPSGFWEFSLFVHLSTIFTFIYNNIDRIFILSLGDLGQLGIYQAIITIYTFSRYLPKLLFNIIVPLLSNLIAGGRRDLIEKTYRKIERIVLLITIPLNIGIISFSRELLVIFGSEYIEYKSVLILFAVSNSLTALSYLNTPLLVVYEKNKQRFYNSLLQIITQLLLTMILMKNYGIYGVAVAKILGILLAQLYPIYIIKNGLDLSIQIPKEFFIGSIITIIYGGIMLLYNSNLIAHMFLFIIFTLLFVLVSGYKKDDLLDIIMMVKKNN